MRRHLWSNGSTVNITTNLFNTGSFQRHKTTKESVMVPLSGRSSRLCLKNKLFFKEVNIENINRFLDLKTLKHIPIFPISPRPKCHETSSHVSRGVTANSNAFVTAREGGGNTINAQKYGTLWELEFFWTAIGL